MLTFAESDWKVYRNSLYSQSSVSPDLEPEEVEPWIWKTYGTMVFFK